MRVAVVSAYHNEPLDMIERCHRSVLGQVVPPGISITHFLVADGKPRPEVADLDCLHFSVPAHGDYGDTPRLIGCASAATLDYDAICMLDADNWFYPEHVATLLAIAKMESVPVVTTTRTLVRLDGTPMRVCAESNGVSFCDTNCYLVLREAFPAFKAWGFKDRRLSVVGDRFFWNEIRTNYRRAHFTKPTVYYTANAAIYYSSSGETPPDGVKILLRREGETNHITTTYGEYMKMVANGEAVSEVDQVQELMIAGLI